MNLLKTGDVLRHPADAKEWKNFDYEFFYFALEPRNIRLELALDEFNMFDHMSTSYIMWHVVLNIPYNLLP